jgi:hypothetical protein
MDECVTVENVVNLLNELIELDPDAVTALVNARVPCNARVASHPTVQVGVVDDGGYRVGPLGLLNGLFKTTKHGWGQITLVFEDGGVIKARRSSGAKDDER